MKEKLKSSLQSLSDFFEPARTAVRETCEKGWNAFCKGVCKGISWLSDRLRNGYNRVSSVADKVWTAFSKSKFAVAVSSFLSNICRSVYRSGPVRFVRTEMSDLLVIIRKKSSSGSEPQPAEKKSPVELVEDNELTTQAIENELRRERFSHRYRRLLRSTVYALIVTAAAAALVATLLLPVLQIYGNSMTPTLREGDIVVSVKTKTYDYGDICSFYYSNRILVKRVIGKPLDVIKMDEDGNVYVNGKLIDEPYIKEKALGECDIEFPYRVPEGSYFMIGDHRLTSIDSRSSAVGCISSDEIVGKIIFTVWPPKHMGISK